MLVISNCFRMFGSTHVFWGLCLSNFFKTPSQLAFGWFPAAFLKHESQHFLGNSQTGAQFLVLQLGSTNNHHFLYVIVCTQDLLNMFFKDIYRPIPPTYNLVLAMLWRHPENIDLERTKVVHYCAAVSIIFKPEI